MVVTTAAVDLLAAKPEPITPNLSEMWPAIQPKAAAEPVLDGNPFCGIAHPQVAVAEQRVLVPCREAAPAGF